jgi:hypothetical protein
MPAWRHAGLKGTPEIQVELKRPGKRPYGTVFISNGEPKALVLDAEPAPGPHWLDQQQVNFHPRTPTYLLVSADGTFAKRTIPADSPLLPSWARKQVNK